MEPEQVLCFPANLMDSIGKFQGTLPKRSDNTFMKYSRELFYNDYIYQFKDRLQVEDDPSWKQLIPYCVLRNKGQVFVYERSSKCVDQRLPGKLSLGIGGHINPVDKQENGHTYTNAVKRELEEEVKLINGYKDNIIGMLYDDTTPLGRVHFGIVHRIIVDNKTSVIINDPSLLNGEWKDITWLYANKDKFEKWSQFVIEDLL